MIKFIIISIVFIIPFSVIYCPNKTQAEEFKPRIVSLKNSTTNVRAGPGTQYPILWVFKHKNWPVKAISKYQYWYKITDNEGETGWIYKNLISNKHTVIINDGKPVTMYKTTEMLSPILKLATNVVLKLDKCNELLCHVNYGGNNGVVLRSRLEMVE